VKYHLLYLVVLCSAGCAAGPSCLSSNALPPIAAAPLDGYRIGCADVVELAFANKPEWDCAVSVGVDGRLPLGAAGRPLVEGRTVPEARTAIAAAAKCDVTQIVLTLAEARARQLYLSGPENNVRRMVPYIGPEPATAFLERAGAWKPNCIEPRRVYVIRENLAQNAKPEIFHVDLIAVLSRGDHTSNIVLEPSDQIVVGETRRSSLARLIPDWFRPIYERLVGLRP